MPNYDIAVNADDYYYAGGTPVTGTTTLCASYIHVFEPPITQEAIGDIDTSAIPVTDVISAATLYYYVQSYASTRRTVQSFYIWMKKADESGYILLSSEVYSGTGWKSYALTAGEYAEIDKGSKSMIKFTCGDPGATKSRALQVRAREYVIVDTYDMYLDVTHAPVATTFVPTMQMF